MNEKSFFDSVRGSLFGGKLLASQVEGIQAILSACREENICDNRYKAYILATAFHETAGTMRAIEEYGKGKGYDYGKKLDMGAGPGKRVPYSTPDKIYYGRGFVQLTWRSNYLIMGKLLGIDLLNRPELALQTDIAAKILVKGMAQGLFTGRKLSHYFTTTSTDYYNARRIVNGLDKAALIAVYADKFYKALTAV